MRDTLARAPSLFEPTDDGGRKEPAEIENASLLQVVTRRHTINSK